MKINVTFHGAAEGVTGSKHLLEVNGHRILIDCGLFQGHREESRHRNLNLPFDPASIHNVVLTHAHIDHSGALPVLCRDGFKGHIIATPATVDLARILLADSGHIHESDAKYLNRRREKKARKHGQTLKPKNRATPLYTINDALACEKFFHELPYEVEEEIAPGVFLSFTDQGHIIGAAAALFRIPDGDKEHRILFSGDRGRSGMPILRDPTPYPPCDILFTESTYGDRSHRAASRMGEDIAVEIDRIVETKGKVIIPAFSVGRTQNILYDLRVLRRKGRIPSIPIFVDSPLSTKASRVYGEHPECFDEKTLSLLQGQDSPLAFAELDYVASVDESKALNRMEGPAVILSASGMCESGRILHHLKSTVEDERNTILLVGFMARHTLGRRLVEREKDIRIFGKTYELKARVARMNGFSAHADREDLLRSVEHLKGTLKTIYLVHGEPRQSNALAESLRAEGHSDVRLAKYGATDELI